MVNSRYFIGVLLMVLGLLFLAEELFDKDLPILPILIPLFLIALGFQLISRSRKNGDSNPSGQSLNPSIFGKGAHKITKSQIETNYTAIFGEQNLDFTGFEPLTDNIETSVLTIFGNTKIFLPGNLNCKIQGTVILGEQTYPNGYEKIFGDQDYLPAHFDGDQPALYIDCNTILGDTKVFLINNDGS